MQVILAWNILAGSVQSYRRTQQLGRNLRGFLRSSSIGNAQLWPAFDDRCARTELEMFDMLP